MTKNKNKNACITFSFRTKKKNHFPLQTQNNKQILLVPKTISHNPVINFSIYSKYNFYFIYLTKKEINSF